MLATMLNSPRSNRSWSCWSTLQGSGKYYLLANWNVTHFFFFSDTIGGSVEIVRNLIDARAHPTSHSVQLSCPMFTKCERCASNSKHGACWGGHITSYLLLNDEPIKDQSLSMLFWLHTSIHEWIINWHCCIGISMGNIRFIDSQLNSHN